MYFFSKKNYLLHAEYNQLERQKKALNLEMASVNRENKTGTIKDHKVSLDHCTCVDFQKHRKPCKHIYRLAFELGIFNLDAEKIDAQLAANPQSLNVVYEPKRSHYSLVPKNFVVIDFETANDFKNSICQMGIAVVENNSIIMTRSFMIRPPYEKFTNTEIHGITFEQVKDSPTFEQLWPEIKIFIEKQVVAAYNVPFDISCLLSTLKFYKIRAPKFSTFDILENVRECDASYNCKLARCVNHRLVTVAEVLGFAHDAHDALSDAVVAAKIQLWLKKKFPKELTLVSVSR